jgi:alkylation response protein AidB-like acyl-CoA dehydrogenase
VRTDTQCKPQAGISFLLIDMKSPGVTVRPIKLLDGECEVNEVWFDNVEVPAENLIGEENKGWNYAKYLLAHERTNIADVNRAKRELERLKRIAKAEGVWEDQRFRDQIALLEVDVVALEMLVLRVLSAEKSGKTKPGHRGPAENSRQRNPATLCRADDAGRWPLQPALHP